MDRQVATLLETLCAEAERHDAAEPDRLRKWRVLEPAAGRLLWFLVHSMRARDVLEIGTSRGISTLWLAEATSHTSGHVTSVDTDADAQRYAARNVDRAELADHVTFHVGDGGRVLAETADASVDVLFLDAERSEYPDWWPHPRRVLRPGGLLIVDNATSHPDEIEPLRALLTEDPQLTVTTLEIGNGELVALRDGSTVRP